MRTTIDLDDDILQAAKELASGRGMTIGRVVSDLARKGLATRPREVTIRNGVPVLTPRAPGEARATMKSVNDARDEGEK